MNGVPQGRPWEAWRGGAANSVVVCSLQCLLVCGSNVAQYGVGSYSKVQGNETKKRRKERMMDC